MSKNSVTAPRWSDGLWSGVLGREITDRAIDSLAVSIAEKLRDVGAPHRRVVLGFDRRFRSEALAEHLGGRLSEHNIPVVLAAGACPTIALSLATAQCEAGLGVMLTGGGLPAEWHGVALRSRQGAPLAALPHAPDDDADASWIDPSSAAPREPESPKQLLARADFLEPYFLRLGHIVPGNGLRHAPPQRIAIDSMHGVVGRSMGSWLRGTPFKPVYLRTTPDPLFAGLCPDPFIKTRRDLLARAVQRRHCSWGVAFNGDGSAVNVVDHRGQRISSSLLLAIVFEHLVRRRHAPGALGRTSSTDPLLDALARDLQRKVVETPQGLVAMSDALRSQRLLIVGDHRGRALMGLQPPDSDPLLFVLFLMEAVAMSGMTVEGLAADIERRYWPIRESHLTITADPALLAERLATMLDDPPRRIGSSRVHQAVVGDTLRLVMKDGAWVALRIDPDTGHGCIDAGGPTTTQVERLVENAEETWLGCIGPSVIGRDLQQRRARGTS